MGDLSNTIKTTKSLHLQQITCKTKSIATRTQLVDGGFDFTEDGVADGALDGTPNGAFDGVPDGGVEGALDGALEGDAEGSWVTLLGAGVGCTVGLGVSKQNLVSLSRYRIHTLAPL